ncbi:MAG: carboxypeptidase-like regulatory domain-containing protein, partial [Paludibacter sp.]|nr:carboxypeptidase-like regulatory domain-containing protein [Paludibacter sp.]
MKKAFYILISLLVCALTVHAQGIKVTGKVIDNTTNEAIIGGSVLVRGTNTGTITDLDGNFSITVSSPNAVLVFSYVGMQTKEITVGEKVSGLTITLSPETKLLEEVVVVGFGTQKKVNLTGAVKSIDNKVFESRPIANAVQGLQGA